MKILMCRKAAVNLVIIRFPLVLQNGVTETGLRRRFDGIFIQQNTLAVHAGK